MRVRISTYLCTLLMRSPLLEAVEGDLDLACRWCEGGGEGVRVRGYEGEGEGVRVRG